MFWSEIGSGFGEPGGTPLPRIPRSTSPTPGGVWLEQNGEKGQKFYIEKSVICFWFDDRKPANNTRPSLAHAQLKQGN